MTIPSAMDLKRMKKDGAKMSAGPDGTGVKRMDHNMPEQTSSDELHNRNLGCASFASAHDFEQILRDIGYHLCSLGDAVTACADRNTSLLDTSLRNCQAVLQDMFHRQADLASMHPTLSLDYSNAWTAGASSTEDTYAVSKTLDVPNTQVSKVDKESKASCVNKASYMLGEHGSVDPRESSARQEQKSHVLKESVKNPDAQICTDFESGNDKLIDSKPEIQSAKSRLITFRILLAKLMLSRFVESLVGSLIVANALVLGHQSDWSVREINADPPIAYRVLDIFFTCAFTLELFLRVCADGPIYFFSVINKDWNWNVFDLIMVLSALVDEIVGTLVEGRTANMSAVRVLRILRLARVIRIIRLMRFFQDLRLMVAGIVSCMKPLTWALCLLCLIMFCVAVCILQFVAAELKGSHLPPDLKEKYGTLPLAMSTLYMSITGGIDWIDATNPLVDVSPILGIFFGCYVAFAIFCCLNIVTGVFVENAHKMSARDEDHMIMEEMEKQHYWLEDVKRAFAAADQDGSAMIDFEEFKAFQQNPRMQAFLRRLGVDWSLETADRLFKQLDFDNTGTISFDEFIMAIQSLTGQTRAMDMIYLMHDTKVIKHQVAKLLQGQAEADRDFGANGKSFRISEGPGLFEMSHNRSTRAMIQPIRSLGANENHGKERGRHLGVGAHGGSSNPRDNSIVPVAESTKSLGTSLPGSLLN